MRIKLQQVGISYRCGCGSQATLGKEMCARCQAHFDRIQEEAAEIRLIEQRLASLESALSDHRIDTGNSEEHGFARGVEAGVRFHLHMLGLDVEAELPRVTAAVLDHYHRCQREEAVAAANANLKLAS